MVHVETKAGENILTFVPAKTYQSVVFSLPELASGTGYIVYSGGSSTGTATDGLYSGGTYTPGTVVTNFTISAIVTNAGSAGAKTPGAMPGNRTNGMPGDKTGGLPNKANVTITGVNSWKANNYLNNYTSGKTNGTTSRFLSSTTQSKTSWMTTRILGNSTSSRTTSVKPSIPMVTAGTTSFQAVSASNGITYGMDNGSNQGIIKTQAPSARGISP